jgi:hypothetical protein
VDEFLSAYNADGAPGTRDILYCFNQRGRILWELSPGRTVRTSTEEFSLVYHVRSLLVARGRNGAADRLVVASYHSPHYPTQIVLLGNLGKPIREYWHSGHLSPLFITDLEQDGRDELYLAGISNSLKETVIVVLDPNDFTGASAELDPRYQLLGFDPPREVARAALPNSAIAKVLVPYGSPTHVNLSDSTFNICLTENPSEDVAHLASTCFTFGPRLKLEDVSLSDFSRTTYRALVAEGRLSQGEPESMLPELRKVRVLTPWREVEKKRN